MTYAMIVHAGFSMHGLLDACVFRSMSCWWQWLAPLVSPSQPEKFASGQWTLNASPSCTSDSDDLIARPHRAMPMISGNGSGEVIPALLTRENGASALLLAGCTARDSCATCHDNFYRKSSSQVNLQLHFTSTLMFLDNRCFYECFILRGCELSPPNHEITLTSQWESR